MTAVGGIFYSQSEFKASGVAKVIDGGLAEAALLAKKATNGAR